jgi:hypothetical protein
MFGRRYNGGALFGLGLGLLIGFLTAGQGLVPYAP